MKKRYIHEGELFVSREPIQIATVLGSCVAVCLYDEVNSIGGMNHYLLPLWNGEGLKTLKYGNISTDRLIHEMLRMGAKRENIVAKIFGGAAINVNSSISVGSRNTQVANDVLVEYGIFIASSDCEGSRGRKILLDTTDGSVYLKYV